MKEQKNIPKLRFPEFKGEWERKKLGEVTTYVDYRGKAPIKTEEGRFLVTAKNIKKGFIDYECSKEFVGENDYLNVMSKGIPRIGDILFTTEAPMGNVAQLERDDIALAQRVIKFRGCEKIENNYLLHYMLSTIFQNEISEKAIGTTVQGISGKELHKVNVSYPTLPEQKRIASFFTVLDKKIAELKQKNNLLEQYKKGVMQSIFNYDSFDLYDYDEKTNPKSQQSQKSNKSPFRQLRFKDDNGKEFPKWEKKKLGEVLEIQGGYAFKSNLFNLGNTKVVRIGDIDPNIYLEKFNGAISLENPDLKYQVKKNDFLMALSGATFGKVGKIMDDGIGFINQRVALFRTKECLEYYYQLVQTDDFKNYISSIPTASAQPNISNSDILNFETYTPSLPEQTKIANFLSAIDEKINQTENQIQQTQLYKKGLLQKMFV